MTQRHTFSNIDFMYIYSPGWQEKKNKTLNSYNGMFLHSQCPKLNSNLIQKLV